MSYAMQKIVVAAVVAVVVVVVVVVDLYSLQKQSRRLLQ
jgi:flagellar biosynthesis/type III secretory pathway M-ring protein FliF/YscJ